MMSANHEPKNKLQPDCDKSAEKDLLIFVTALLTHKFARDDHANRQIHWQEGQTLSLAAQGESDQAHEEKTWTEGESATRE